ncbi:hypothetical protein [Nitrincola nitratireducens]|uniref:Uncharacterized protein n=1 Tax=Nitrincola nitratireducens TaxID=1229521 RepID=W9V071_9GAMM|nr:hypothetical protein [Nitrincola nitratireducens]EXJ12744.1 hypothetical protein D791_00085 [Nitrincola nitratireducens]
MSTRQEPQLNIERLKDRSEDAISILRADVQLIKQQQKRGVSIFFRLLILLLLVAVGGLGWKLIELNDLLDRQQAVLASTQADLEAQLQRLDRNMSENQQVVDVTEASFADMLASVEAESAENYGYLNSEIIKIWDQMLRLRPEDIGHMQASLIQQEAALDAINQAIQQLQSSNEEVAVLSNAVDRLEERFTQNPIDEVVNQLRDQVIAITVTLEQLPSVAQVSDMNDRLDQLTAAADVSEAIDVEPISRRLDEIARQLQTQEAQIASQITQLQNDQRRTDQRLAGLNNPAPSVPVGLETKVNQHEIAIQAIDGSRIQISRDILQLREQVNRIQLRLEQMN